MCTWHGDCPITRGSQSSSHRSFVSSLARVLSESQVPFFFFCHVNAYPARAAYPSATATDRRDPLAAHVGVYPAWVAEGVPLRRGARANGSSGRQYTPRAKPANAAVELNPPRILPRKEGKESERPQTFASLSPLPFLPRDASPPLPRRRPGTAAADVVFPAGSAPLPPSPAAVSSRASSRFRGPRNAPPLYVWFAAVSPGFAVCFSVRSFFFVLRVRIERLLFLADAA